MKLFIEIPVNQTLEECADQTSIDLMSMRARGVETSNAVYDDWVITKDMFPIIYPMLDEYAADMAFMLRTMVESYDVDKEDHIQYTVNVSDDVQVTPSIDRETKAYFKGKILAWWYQYRDADLSVFYANKAEAALNNVFMLCIPRTGTSIGRYF